MNAMEDDAPWERRDEFVRSGIPLDVYRRQVALAHRLRKAAFGRAIKVVALALQQAIGRVVSRGQERSVCNTKNGHSSTMHSTALNRLTLSGRTGPWKPIHSPRKTPTAA